MRIGVIGTGNIGGMLAQAFAASHLDVFVYNRTACKAEILAEASPNIHLTGSPREVADTADVVFLCTKPYDGQVLLADIGPAMNDEQLLVATISTFPLAAAESLTRAGLAKVIPSIVQCQRSGILLVRYGPSMTARQQLQLHDLLAHISTPFAVEEDQIRICSDLASCGPAFLSCLLKQWAEAASRTERLSNMQAEHLLTTTLIGVANLLQSGMTLQDIISRVAIPGGVTEAGLVSLSKDGIKTFEHLHQSTCAYAHGANVVKLSSR